MASSSRGAIALQMEVNPWQSVLYYLEAPGQGMRDFALAQFDVRQEASLKASLHRVIIMMCGYPTSPPASSFLR